eukprot:3149617-Rhodomonas_salina.2
MADQYENAPNEAAPAEKVLKPSTVCTQHARNSQLARAQTRLCLQQLIRGMHLADTIRWSALSTQETRVGTPKGGAGEIEICGPAPTRSKTIEPSQCQSC